MNDVVVTLLDGKEILFNNATFIVDHKLKSVSVATKNDETLIAVFNFNNVAGVRVI